MFVRTTRIGRLILAAVSVAVVAVSVTTAAAGGDPKPSAAVRGAPSAPDDGPRHGRGELPVWPEEPKIADHPVTQRSAAPTINLDYSQAPDLEPVAMRAKEVLLEWYPRISDMLPTEGYVPPQEFDVVFDPAYDGAAAVSGTTMTVGVDYMRGHPDDLGMFVHEAVHINQQYGSNNVPGWLTEGIADYIRYYHFQPDDNPIPGEDRTHYTDGYGQAAFLLNHVQTVYTDAFVSAANDAARRNVYADQIWVDHTGKDTETLWNEAVSGG